MRAGKASGISRCTSSRRRQARSSSDPEQSDAMSDELHAGEAIAGSFVAILTVMDVVHTEPPGRRSVDGHSGLSWISR